MTRCLRRTRHNTSQFVAFSIALKAQLSLLFSQGLGHNNPSYQTLLRIKMVNDKARLPEPLLDDNPDRFCMFPITHKPVWEMYKKAEASFWTGERRYHVLRLPLLPSRQWNAPAA